MRRTSLILILNIYLLTVFGQKDTSKVDKGQLYDIPITELSNVKVTSFSKKEERIQDVTASIYVITEFDIDRSTATNLIELLQVVPGFYYKNTVRNLPSISIREETNSFVGTVLVIVDGVVMQSWFTSGFTFGSFDIPLQTIKRIEIIRGPGGTLYGNNAATGVINVITKTGNELLKLESWASIGTNQFGLLNYSTGTSLTDKSKLSFYFQGQHFGGFDLLKEFDGDFVEVPVTDDPSKTITIENKFAEDSQDITDLSTGFKFNTKIDDKTELMWNAHFTSNSFSDYAIQRTNFLPVTTSTRLLEVNSWQWYVNLQLQRTTGKNNHYIARGAYKSDVVESFIEGGFQQKTDYFDLEIQDNYSLNRHTFTFGGTVRLVHFNETRNSTNGNLQFVNPDSYEVYYSVIAQDKIEMLQKKINLLGGLKAEGWSLIQTKPTFSPNIRISYQPVKDLTFWAAATRSVTTPGFLSRNARFKQGEFPPPAFFIPSIIEGLLNQGLDSAQAIALAPSLVPNFAGKDLVLIGDPETKYTIYNNFEIGFRTTAVKNFWIELALFYTKISGVIRIADIDINMTIPDPLDPSNEIVPIIITNSINGTLKGIETVIKYQKNAKYYLEFSHSFLKNNREWVPEFDHLPDPNPTEGPLTPVNVFRLRGGINFYKGFEFSFDGFYATRFNNGDTYRYDDQEPLDGLNLFPDETKNRTFLNLKLQKKFFENTLTTYLWGRDVLTSKPFIEEFDSFVVAFPRTVHSLWGIGVKLKIE